MRDKVWDSESKFNFYVTFLQPYATAAKRSLKKLICAFSKFIALIPPNSICRGQM